MNEKIKELADQAGFEEKDGHISIQGVYMFNTHRMEKFAELIVWECIKQVEKNFAGAVGTYAGVHNSAVLKCKKSIQEHFGVEE